MHQRGNNNKTSPWREEDCTGIPAASLRQNYGGGEGGRPTDSVRSCEDKAPTNTGAKDGEDNSQRSGAEKNFSLRGEGRPLSPAASSAPNL